MPRAVPEWQGRTPESMPPKTVFDRLWAKQDGKDAITGIAFTSKDRVVRDHKIPLADGGANSESNLQIITEGSHKLKTASEAGQRAKERSVRSKARGYDRSEKSRLQGPGFGRRPSNARELYGDVPEAERGEK